MTAPIPNRGPTTTITRRCACGCGCSTCTLLIEREHARPAARAVRDHAAALRPHGAARAQSRGLKMGELSRRMMVTGGNVTGIIDQLAEGGWSSGGRAGRPARLPVRLTKGKRAFDAMAARTRAGWSTCWRARASATVELLGRLTTTSARDPARRPKRGQATDARAPLEGLRDRRSISCWQAEGKVGDDHAESAREEESADVRLLRGAARPVP